MTASGTGGDDPLAGLVVLDRLEVGPARLERNGLTCPYRVVSGGGEASTELHYRYGRDVFEPGEPASENLAAWMSAQVALNYGLFCREIVFRGPLDEIDRAFLARMAENTAREIYVKKFLEPNPFLVGAASRLPAIERERYLAARLRFPDLEPAAPESWAGDPGRAGVLASGGKDSLLSLGLLDELGLETHSLFVNESGRHWYTALNAHRELSRARPETTHRVWTSSDRVFSWMLRRLPFVRPDFARLRADEYPIRLWTVAVFLAGALPLARRLGLGLLAIGDEFDTTVERRHRGVPHYDGLYDQSLRFDRALTRTFRAKGWRLEQFSALRQLSEMAIQKILAERYPSLHRLQVSCHATHLEGERALPCGRCEKCRRIVGMHLALDADPGVCGYTEEQIAGCLEALARSGVHQEAAGGRHLAWRLRQRGLLEAGGPFADSAAEHPEIETLRFHPDASPAAAVPATLRAPLFRILGEHLRGAVTRRGGAWVPVELDGPALLEGGDRGGPGPGRR